MNILEIKNFSKTYKGNKKAVDNLCITVEAGDIYGFIGHNGAGKSTTIKSVVGVLEFTEGEIYIDGHSVKKEPMECKSITAYIPDNPDIYEFLTGIQYLNFVADIFGIEQSVRQERIKTYGDLFGITENLGDLISSYSHGMKQKVAIISALVHEPKLLVLDEPFVGLDPKAALDLKNIMKELCRQGSAIFFSTHVLEVAQKLCNKIAIIKDAFIINPAPGQDTKQVLEQLQGTKPFVLIMQDIYSYEADAASSFVTVKPDNYKMGQELAEQMLKNTSGLMNGKRIGVVAGNARTEESRNRVRGFCEVMEAGGGRIIWKYNQESKEDAGEILKAKEKVDYLAVLDPYILDEVGEKAENGFYSGAEIYGIGTSIKAFSLLDAGKIQCLIVPDLYEVGYESMNEIASKLKNSWYQMESHETEIQVVYKKDLFSEDIERFLYSYE